MQNYSISGKFTKNHTPITLALIHPESSPRIRKKDDQIDSTTDPWDGSPTRKLLFLAQVGEGTKTS